MSKQTSTMKKYIIPAMISNTAFFLLTVVDGMFVGNGVGIDALGAISLTMPYVMVIGALSVLFAVGGIAVTAVRLGRDDVKGANSAFMHSFTAILVIFGLLSVTGCLLSDQLATLLGANETYHEMVSEYIFWYSLFLIPCTEFTCLSNFCRNDGDPILSTIACVSCVALNIFGDWLLVYPLQKGIAGAAFATGASSILACAILSLHYLKKRGRLRFARFRFSFRQCRKIMLRGVPDMVAQFGAPITTYSMNRVLIGISDPHVNAFSVLTYVGSLFFALMQSVGTGLQPLYGQSYGAKDEKSLKFYFRSGLTISAIGGIALFTATLFLGDAVCWFFNADAAAVDLVKASMPKYCVSYVFTACSAVFASYLFSTKRTPYAITLNTCRSVVFNFLCINFLPLLFGAEFVWYTLAVSEAICLCIAVVLWRVSERKGIIYR